MDGLMGWQKVVAMAIVAVAAGSLLVRLVRSIRGKGKGCKCSTPTSKGQAVNRRQIVSVDELRRSADSASGNPGCCSSSGERDDSV